MSDTPPRKRPIARVNFDVPQTLLDEIKQRAIEQRTTVRGLFLQMLVENGFDTRDHNPAIDGRTLRTGLHRPPKTA